MIRRTLLVAVAAGLCAFAGPRLTRLSAGDSAAPGPPDRPFPAEVLALLKHLDDPAPAVRLEAVQRLRVLARRVDAAGGKRERRGGEFAPKVKGLAPYL